MVKHQLFFSWEWLPPISRKNFPSPHYSCFWKILSSLWRGFRLYYHPVGLLSVVCEVFEKLVINKIVDHLEKCGLFLISSMVLGVLNQLQIFSQLYLIDLSWFLTGLWGYSSNSTWHFQGFWQGLACWSSSQT